MARPKVELDPDEIERYAASGLTNEEIAQAVGVGVDTLYRHKRESIVLGEAIKRGRLKSHVAVSNKLLDLCMAGNVTAIIWYEKSRRGLTDKINVSPEELDAAINRELERIAAAS
jgi:DNA-binding CsgD family transcriptional regulator